MKFKLSFSCRTCHFVHFHCYAPLYVTDNIYYTRRWLNYGFFLGLVPSVKPSCRAAIHCFLELSVPLTQAKTTYKLAVLLQKGA